MSRPLPAVQRAAHAVCMRKEIGLPELLPAAEVAEEVVRRLG